MEMDNLPIFYSLQHCPYAMRARIALMKANRMVRLRPIKLNNKPKEMLKASPKGTVPVLVVAKRFVIDESLEVMLWALAQNDPQDLLRSNQEGALSTILEIIGHFDTEFVPALEAYSCAKRYHANNLDECRQACQFHIQKLEDRLQAHRFLFSDSESLLDIALMPFIRKFARIEKRWFRSSPYPNVRLWLEAYLQSAMFSKVMANHDLWLDSRQDICFGENSYKGKGG